MVQRKMTPATKGDEIAVARLSATATHSWHSHRPSAVTLPKGCGGQSEAHGYKDATRDAETHAETTAKHAKQRLPMQGTHNDPQVMEALALANWTQKASIRQAWQQLATRAHEWQMARRS